MAKYTASKIGQRGIFGGNKNQGNKSGDKQEIISWLKETYHDSETRFTIKYDGDTIISNAPNIDARSALFYHWNKNTI